MSESYLGVTGRFLSPTFEHRAFSLAVRSFPHPHTGVRIKLFLKNVLKEWDISKKKVFVSVTDSSSNMISAHKDLRMQLTDDEEEEALSAAVGQLDDEDESVVLNYSISQEYVMMSLGDTRGLGVQFDEESAVAAEMEYVNETEDFVDKEAEHTEEPAEFNRQPCFNHLLQLAVRKFDTTEDHRQVIKETKKLVTKFNHSAKATASLIQHSGKKLISDVETRWNSTYAMISR